jgi:predicted Zn-dependent protease
VVQNYTQLYGNVGDYTRQLQALEAAAQQQPSSPALRLLLGFHYGYLGYPQQAVRELARSVQLMPADPAARKLHDIFAAKIGVPAVGPLPASAG